jgi:Mn2+/Fe2+ NRAMP family transporter
VRGLAMKWIKTLDIIITIITVITVIYYIYSDDPLAKTLFFASVAMIVMVNIVWMIQYLFFKKKR